MVKAIMRQPPPAGWERKPYKPLGGVGVCLGGIPAEGRPLTCHEQRPAFTFLDDANVLVPVSGLAGAGAVATPPSLFLRGSLTFPLDAIYRTGFFYLCLTNHRGTYGQRGQPNHTPLRY